MEEPKGMKGTIPHPHFFSPGLALSVPGPFATWRTGQLSTVRHLFLYCRELWASISPHILALDPRSPVAVRGPPAVGLKTGLAWLAGKPRVPKPGICLEQASGRQGRLGGPAALNLNPGEWPRREAD